MLLLLQWIGLGKVKTEKWEYDSLPELPVLGLPVLGLLFAATDRVKTTKTETGLPA